MADSSVTVALKERCFASFTIGGVPVELFVESITPSGPTLAIRSPKKIGALRVYQELPGFAPVKLAATAAPSGDLDLSRKRA